MNDSRASVARWRAKHPERARLLVRINAARAAAQRRLADLHPDEFAALFDSELARRGLPRVLPPLPKDLDGRGRKPVDA